VRAASDAAGKKGEKKGGWGPNLQVCEKKKW